MISHFSICNRIAAASTAVPTTPTALSTALPHRGKTRHERFEEPHAR